MPYVRVMPHQELYPWTFWEDVEDPSKVFDSVFVPDVEYADMVEMEARIEAYQQRLGSIYDERVKTKNRFEVDLLGLPLPESGPRSYNLGGNEYARNVAPNGWPKIFFGPSEIHVWKTDEGDYGTRQSR